MNDIQLLNQLPVIPNITDKQLAKIKKRIGEYKRAKSIFGHSTSQTSYTLQTLNMISDSPMSRMKQCMAQIDRKYEAVQHAYFKIENLKLEKGNELRQREIFAQISTIETNMGNALRQIGMFQNMYDEIRISHNIPKDWNESDYEAQEYQNMVRKCFRLAIQDMMNYNTVSKASVEYCEQLGIHPTEAAIITKGYLMNMNKLLEKDKKLPIKHMYDFLDTVAQKYKDNFKFVLERLGLNEIGSEEFRHDYC